MIQIALYKGPPTGWRRQLAHQIVRIFTDSMYSHCELIDGEGYAWTSSWLDGGVRRKLIDFTTGRWDLITVPGDLDKAVAWFKAHEGQPYDYLGLWNWVLPFRVSRTKDAWVCSQAIAEALDWPNAWHVGPGDIPKWRES